MENIRYPKHPIRCIFTGPSEWGKKVIQTKLVFKFFNDLQKIYIYSPSHHQDKYQKLIKCFCNYIPIQIIQIIFYEEPLVVVISEVVTDKNLDKSDIEKETFESLKEVTSPQENNFIDQLFF